jgi:hypothetical protein
MPPLAHTFRLFNWSAEESATRSIRSTGFWITVWHTQRASKSEHGLIGCFVVDDDVGLPDDVWRSEIEGRSGSDRTK